MPRQHTHLLVSVVKNDRFLQVHDGDGGKAQSFALIQLEKLQLMASQLRAKCMSMQLPHHPVF